jgi:hypothetical protein
LEEKDFIFYLFQNLFLLIHPAFVAREKPIQRTNVLLPISRFMWGGRLPSLTTGIAPCFCSARLQAGIANSQECTPEGGRYIAIFMQQYARFARFSPSLTPKLC